MLLHANAKLGLAGRLALVRAIEDGLSLKAAAAAFNCRAHYFDRVVAVVHLTHW
jgi:hypothetical protein